MGDDTSWLEERDAQLQWLRKHLHEVHHVSSREIATIATSLMKLRSLHYQLHNNGTSRLSQMGNRPTPPQED